MKTIEEIFKDHNASGMACEYGYSVEVVGLDLAIKIAKEYAKQVAEQALKDAELRVLHYIDNNISAYHIGGELASELINTTEVKTP